VEQVKQGKRFTLTMYPATSLWEFMEKGQTLEEAHLANASVILSLQED